MLRWAQISFQECNIHAEDIKRTIRIQSEAGTVSFNQGRHIPQLALPEEEGKRQLQEQSAEFSAKAGEATKKVEEPEATRCKRRSMHRRKGRCVKQISSKFIFRAYVWHGTAGRNLEFRQC